MKTLRNEKGQSAFTPDEWRTPKQTSNLFSRLKLLSESMESMLIKLKMKISKLQKPKKL